MIKTFDLTLDIADRLTPEPIYVRQGDTTGSVMLNVRVVNRGEPVAITEDLTFQGMTADNQYVISDKSGFTNIDDAGGSFTYALANQIMMVPGRVKLAYFKVTDGDGHAATVSFTIVVAQAADLNPATADDYISIVDSLEKTIDAKIASVTADLTTTVTKLQSDVDAAVQSFSDADFYTKAETDASLSQMHDSIMADVEAKKYVTYDVISEVPDE